MMLLLALFCLVASVENNRPIIGVFTQPVSKSLSPYGNSYIAASYVKYLESAGARVVPIFHTASQPELKKIFQSINGILFPGGAADLRPTTQFYRSAFFLYQLALDANDRGDYFPIQGTCLGFELLHLMTSRNASLLDWVDAENITLPLSFTAEATTSRLYSSAPSDVIQILKTEAVTMNNHMRSVSPSDYNTNPSLASFFRILSTNKDRKNKLFISSVEAKKYPVYAYQFHPEKPQFEWDPIEVTPHTANAIKANQFFSTFLVSEARKSAHRFQDTETEDKSLIYNYPVMYTQNIIHNFEQCYIFK